MVEWSSWCLLPELPVDRLFLVGKACVTSEPGVLSQRCTTPVFGQGSSRRASGVSDPQDLSGTDRVVFLLDAVVS